MAKKMIISAVSNLETLTGPKPAFAVTPTENMMESSKEKAPVLLRIDSTGTVDGKAFAKMMSDDSQIGAEETALYLNALGEFIAACAADATNVDITLGRIELSISGSLEAGDLPAEDGVHQAQFTFIPCEDIKRTLAAIECHVPADACPADVKRVRDVATGDGAIHGRDPFHIQGVKLTYGGKGEKIELLAADGKTFVSGVEVIENTSEISKTVKLPTFVEPGRYFLSFVTLAGGTKTLWPVGCNVTVVEGEGPVDPTITKVTSNKLGRTDVWNGFGDSLIVDGAGFTDEMPVKFELFSRASGQKVAEQSFGDDNKVIVESPRQAKIVLDGNTSIEPDGVWKDSDALIRLTVGESTRDLAYAAS